MISKQNGTVSDVKELLSDISSPFRGLGSEYLQHKAFKNFFHLLVGYVPLCKGIFA